MFGHFSKAFFFPLSFGGFELKVDVKNRSLKKQKNYFLIDGLYVLSIIEEKLNKNSIGMKIALLNNIYHILTKLYSDSSTNRKMERKFSTLVQTTRNQAEKPSRVATNSFDLIGKFKEI